jgi:hypothetical protein
VAAHPRLCRRLVCRSRLLHHPDVAKDAPIRLTWEITPLGAVRKLVTHDELDGKQPPTAPSPAASQR